VRISTRALLTCGVVAGPLFLLVVVIQDYTRAGFDPRQHPLSMLSLGDLGWIQITNFVVTGLLDVAYALGLRRAWRHGPGGTFGPLLIGGYGLGLVCAGVFVFEPAWGYPPGSPPGLPANPGARYAMHGAAFFVVFASLVAACFVFARSFAAARRPQVGDRQCARRHGAARALRAVSAAVRRRCRPAAAESAAACHRPDRLELRRRRAAGARSARHHRRAGGRVNDRFRVRGVIPAWAPGATATQGHQALQVVHDGSSAECAPCSSPRKHARGRFLWSERVYGQGRGRNRRPHDFSRPGLSAMLTCENAPQHRAKPPKLCAVFSCHPRDPTQVATSQPDAAKSMRGSSRSCWRWARAACGRARRSTSVAVTSMSTLTILRRRRAAAQQLYDRAARFLLEGESRDGR
jgi:hypothetical protein